MGSPCIIELWKKKSPFFDKFVRKTDFIHVCMLYTKDATNENQTAAQYESPLLSQGADYLPIPQGLPAQ